MATPAHDKYYLRSLHEEIDLFDRKLAHSQQFETYKSETEKKVATEKLKAKRELLARTARRLVEDGIEFKNSELPRSFRTEGSVSEAVPVDATIAEEKPVPTVHPMVGRRAPSHFAGTPLDGQAQLEEYRRSRTKTAS